MKKMFLGVLVALLLTGAAFGAEPDVKIDIKVPTDLTVKPGRQLKIPVTTTGKIVKWYIDNDNADLTVDSNNKAAVFSALVPGKYKIVVYTASGDMPSDPVICIVTVEGTPPDPVPVPPADTLVPSLIKAYGSDTGADKVANLQQLTDLWQKAATKTVFDTDIKTAGKLLEVLHTAADGLMKQGLMPVRDAIRVELDTKLPRGANTPLDDATRKVIAVQFQRVADALGKVK